MVERADGLRRRGLLTRRTAAALVVALLGGLLADTASAGPAAAQSTEPVEITYLQLGDHDLVIEDFADLNCPQEVFGPTCVEDNIEFPSSFLASATPEQTLTHGNTPFDCPAAQTCAVETARSVWVFGLHPGERIPESDWVTVSVPAGTVLSESRFDYVMQDADRDDEEIFGRGAALGQVAHTASEVERISPQQVRIRVTGSSTEESENLYIWMANVINPPSGEHSRFNFRFETTQQDEFPGVPGNNETVTNSSPVVANSVLTADRGVVTVGDSASLTATLRDRYGNPVPDSDAAIEPMNGSATVEGTPITRTGSDGQVIFRYTDRVVETVEFQALSFEGSFAFQLRPDVSFVAAAPDPTYSEVLVQPSTVPADGTTAAVVVVRLADRFANPVLGDELVLIPMPLPGQPSDVFTRGFVEPAPASECAVPSAPLPGLACANVRVTSPDLVDPAGAPVRQAEARFLVRNPTAETVRFTVNDLTKGTTLATEATVTFEATAPAATSIGPATQTVTANGTAIGTVVATIQDAEGNPVAGVDVTLNASAGSAATVVDDTVTTGDDGRAEFSVRSTVVETVSFTATYDATVGGAPVSGDVDGVALIEFVAGPPSGTTSTLVADPTSRLADGTAASTVTASVRDASGLPVTGRAVTLTANSGSSAVIAPVAIPVALSGCAVGVPAGTTDCNGDAAFRVVDDTVETVTLTAAIPSLDLAIVETATVDFTAPPGVDASSISAVPDSVLADGSSAAMITVVLRDADGDPLPGKVVCLTQSTTMLPGDAPCPDGATGPSTVVGAEIPSGPGMCATQAPAGTTDCQGRARFAATATAAGTVLYGVIDLTDFPTSPLGPTVAVEFRPVPTEASRSSVEADVATAVADGGSSAAGLVTVTVTLRDGAGAILDGRATALDAGASSAVAAAVAIPSSVSGCATQAAAGITDCAGQARFVVSDTVPEEVTLAASDLDAGIEITQTATVTFLPDEAAVSTVVAAPTQAVADGGATPAGRASVLVTLSPGTPLVGHRVVLLQSSGAGSRITATTIPAGTSGCATAAAAGTSDCNGQVLFTVTDDVPEVVVYRAFDLTTGVLLQESATVTFLTGPPLVTGIAPASGVEAGGTVVTISGIRFSPMPGATTVTFGGVPAQAVTCPTASSCTVTAPPHPAGVVDVVATTPSGPSTPGSPGAHRFTYVVAPPVVTGISPASGPVAGGTVVTVSGFELTGATSVLFGTASVPVTSVDPAGTSVTAIAPASTAGTVDVRVTTPGGTSVSTAAARYQFVGSPPPPPPPPPPRPCTTLLCRLFPWL